MVYIFGFGRMALLLGFPLLFAVVILAKFIYDNNSVYGTIKSIKVIPLSIMLYLPIAITILPAIYITRTVESFVLEKSNKLHEKCQDKIRIIQEEQERVVTKSREEDRSVWWKPWSWGDKVNVMYQEVIREMVTKPITEKASLGARIIYGYVVCAFDFAILLNRIFEIFIIFTSFGFVYSQTLVGRGETEVKY